VLHGRRRLGFAAGHHRPGDTPCLVGQRHGGQFRRFPLQQLRGPVSAGVVLPRKPHDGRGADDEQPATMGVALLDDPDLALRTTAAVRLRNSDPSGTAAAIALAAIGPMPGMVATRRLMSLGRCDATMRLQLLNPSAQLAKLVDESIQHPARRLGQVLQRFVQRFNSSLDTTGPFAAMIPNSARWPRRPLINIVRCRTSKSRVLYNIKAPCWSTVLIATKRVIGQVTAAQIASASTASV
jgi:hypothetical protein